MTIMLLTVGAYPCYTFSVSLFLTHIRLTFSPIPGRIELYRKGDALMFRHTKRGGSWLSLLALAAISAVLIAGSGGVAAAGPAVDFSLPGALINNWNPNLNGFS